MKQNTKNETEILGVITKMQEQLLALNKKIDILMMRALVVPGVTPSYQKPIDQPVQVNRPQHEHPKGKMSFQVICADCKKECSIPFKPSGDRPVYCKECFSRRRNGGQVKVEIGNKPKEVPPVAVITELAPAVKEKKKPSTIKKTAAKKKPLAKKKKAKK